MSDTANALAPSKMLEWGGKTYKMVPLTFYSLAKFSTWMENQALAFAERAKAKLSPDTHKALLRGISSDVACRLYEPGGPYFRKAEETETGQRKLLELQIEGIYEEALIDLWLDDAKREEAQQIARELNSSPFAQRGMRIPMGI